MDNLFEIHRSDERGHEETSVHRAEHGPEAACDIGLKPVRGTPYWVKTDIDGPQGADLPAWAKTSLAAFRETILNPAFPCMFASSSERRGQLAYAFADTAVADRDVDHIGRAITAWLESLRCLPQNEADYHVLVIFTKPAKDRSLANYAADAQALLTALHHRDSEPWPRDLPTDEDDPRWSFAFAGTALFANISTPANHIRRSRNVGPSLALVISPRDVFDRVAGPDEKGRRIRANIRRRTTDFDGGLPSAPWGTVAYGEGGVGMERKQYILPDDNDHPIDLTITMCPHHRGD